MSPFIQMHFDLIKRTWTKNNNIFQGIFSQATFDYFVIVSQI